MAKYASGEVFGEVCDGFVDDGVERAGLFKQVRSTVHHAERIRPADPGDCFTVELEHFFVVAADDEERRGAELLQVVAGKVGATPSLDDGTNHVGTFRGGHNRSGGTRA